MKGEIIQVNNYVQMNTNQIPGGYQPDHIKRLCKKYMNYHVMGQLNDGSQFEGIIDNMDEESVTMLVPEDINPGQLNRQFGYGYNDDNDYDYDDYGRPRRRRYRRFRRRRFPYRSLISLLLYPYFPPQYPPYPPYPYGYYGGY